DRDQHVVRHDAVGALHEEIEDLPGRERRIHAAVGEPREKDPHSHERECGRKPEHDAHADQREHEQAEIAVGKVSPRREHDHRDHDQRDQRETEPELLAHLHWRDSWRTTSASSFWMSSSLTWTISFNLSTSTSCTSSSRDGHLPRLMQITQRMISTMPCMSTSA